MYLIEVQNIEKSFNGHKVLKGISFNIKEGECLALYGKSGAGKSILIHIIRGMKDYVPDKGKVIYHVSICPSCDWVDLPRKEGSNCPVCNKAILEYAKIDYWNSDEKIQGAIKSRIAIMLQKTFGLYGSFTTIENILEALKKVRTLSENEKIDEAIKLIKAFKLTHRMLHPAYLLSGGEKQRVVLARQLAMRPILLLADEPTGTLDPINSRMIEELLKKEVKDKGSTLMLTSHNPQTVLDLADRVLWLDKGRVLKEVLPSEFMREMVGEFKEVVSKPLDYKEEVLRVIGVKKFYYSIDRGLVKAVDDVSFSVYEEEIFGIMGPSGAGKTTLSRIMAGITEPSSGKIYIKIGEKFVDIIQRDQDRGVALSYVGLLHQEYSLYPYRIVLENLTNSIGLELPMELAEMKAIYTLKSVGFDDEEVKDLLDKYPDQLSEGERHRVALAQVLIKEPEIVVLDEPSGTMDPVTKSNVALSIRKSRDEFKQTFIIVTHDVDFARLTCDRVALMNDGKIMSINTPGKAIENLLSVIC
ncbi:MAG: methyl coenzyme M reductase system, component A2 [Candidatus Methylarchaceae archaeon HK01B]|nr:methyl coenzyme M reductase system, component A2 [Candidatus Methylarchaceae archaeon HK01B]